jgi:hypothetical protein
VHLLADLVVLGSVGNELLELGLELLNLFAQRDDLPLRDRYRVPAVRMGTKISAIISA